MIYLWVALGSALGGVLRFGVAELIAATKWGSSFPLGTLLVNTTGCIIIGFFNMWTSPDGRLPAPPHLRIFFMVGICGGYTTFSSFSLQTLTLLNEGKWSQAAANVLLSVTLCLGGVWFGSTLGGLWNSSAS